jgi:hypothetical protein
MKYVLFALLVYLAYQFIFNLVIPVYRTSRRIRKGFKEMHSRMQQESSNAGQQPHDFKERSTARPDPDDYIEFEEVK